MEKQGQQTNAAFGQPHVSKFKSATATQITNQLLTTARKDTLLNYTAAIYGVGEASLAHALAPVPIH